MCSRPTAGENSKIPTHLNVYFISDGDRNWIFLKCKILTFYYILYIIWAATCNFQQCGILTWIDSDDPVQPPVKLRNSKSCSVRSLTFIEFSCDKQRLWSDCAYAQAGLSHCWSHIPNCWKCHVAVHFVDTFCPAVICFHRYHRKKTFYNRSHDPSNGTQ